MIAFEKLRAETLALPESDRAGLAQCLFKSLGSFVPGFEEESALTDAAEKLRPALLALSEDYRSELGHDFLESLRSEAEEETFMKELARREADMLSGRVVGLTSADFFAHLDAHLASLKESAQSKPGSRGV